MFEGDFFFEALYQSPEIPLTRNLTQWGQPNESLTTIPLKFNQQKM
jgi:hypothetical protein